MVTEFNDADTSAYCGATNFNDGKKPIIDQDEPGLLFIGSGVGIEVYESVNDENDCYDDGGVWQYHAIFPTQEGCRTFMRALPGTIPELEAIGFKRIS